MKIYERKLHPEMRSWIDKPYIIVLTGMRQVGKTTLMRMLYDEIKSENKVFLDLENPLTRRVFDEEDYNNIWRNLASYGISKEKKAYVFLDELQLMPKIVSALKYLFDHYSVQFFATGSSSFYLKNLFSESLSGRKKIFEIFPLDFEEFLWFKGIHKEFHDDMASKEKIKSRVEYERLYRLYDEFLKYGAFPKAVKAHSIVEKRSAVEDVFTSYFEKDVKSIADFKHLGKLEDAMLLLAKRVGSKINVTRMASELGISRETMYSYLNFLEATYFITLLPPYSKSPDKEVSGAKKLYFCDTGLLNILAESASGAIFENAMCSTLKKFGRLSYYERRSGGEIDFILKDNGIAIEAKESATGRDVKRLKELSRDINLKQSYVISKSYPAFEGAIAAIDL